MFNTKTLFVLGAGASVEMGLPTGEKLKPEIAKLLNYHFDFGQQKSGDPIILDALLTHVRNTGVNDVSGYISAARQIHDNIDAAISIDNFIDTHRHNKELELCGKLSIVRSILMTEGKSALKYSGPGVPRYDKNKLVNSWLPIFFRKLHENVTRDDVGEILQNLSFIIFNYDRCFEHFLAQALEDYYAISAAESQQLVNRATIFHPYGTVGSLQWQPGGRKVGFGDSEPRDLLGLTEGIKTFTQGMQDDQQRAGIEDAIFSAETIVFLGFSFHQQNLAILQAVRPPTRGVRILGTSAGISPQDTALVRADLQRMLTVNGDRYDRDIQLPQLHCIQFFQQYWRQIGAAI